MNPILTGIISSGSAYYNDEPTDPQFSSVRLLMHFNGANGSTTMTDSSPISAAYTAQGNASLSSAQSVYGGASLALDGAGDYIYREANTDFNMSDFTLEGWLRMSETPTTFNPVMASGSPVFNAGCCWLGIYPTQAPLDLSNRLVIANYNNGPVITSSSTLAPDEWYHFAFTRQSNTMRMFIDGNLENQLTRAVGNFDFGYGGTNIGGVGWNSSEYFNGFLDDLRFSSVARYTSSFTPPSQQYPSQ